MTADEAMQAATRAGLPVPVAARLVLDTHPLRYPQAIEAAAAVAVLCRLANRPGQIGQHVGKSIEQARADINAEMVAETDATYIDKTPPRGATWKL